ncbi:MAG: hypothetical protein KDE59_07950, partial [Anaerolineales bacterium]|nr:hypothetical protein [Anaerolineales bacterium]
MFTRTIRLLTTIILPASLLLALFAFFRPAAPLQAATLTVDTFVDERDFSCADGDCSLRDAVIVAAPGDTISVPAGNYQLTLSGGLGPLVVDSDLIITGVSSATTIITNDGCGFANCGSLVSVTSGATLTLNNITLANSRANGFPGFNGGGVLVGNGHLIINDASISNNGAPSGRGGGVAVLNGTLTLNSGTISNNTSYDDGAGVYLAGATASFTMNGGTIADNYTQCTDGCASGGGVYAASGTFNLTAGTISGNRADNGAAVFYGSGGGTISGGTIRDNRNTFLSGPRGGVGGGISILSGIVTMSGGQIISNTGRVDGFFPGGGVRVENATFNMSGGLISNNEAYRGGAVMVQTGTFNFSGGTLESNTANYGGAVYLNNDTAYMYQSGGIVASNTATTTTDYGGGAFYVTLGHYIGTGGEIRENFSHYYGGAVSIANGTASFDGMSIISNTATITGGLIHLRDNGAVVTITNNIIRGNVPNAVASTNADVDVFFEGNDVSYHAVALHMPFGRMLAYANNFENNTVAIDAAGNGGFDGRHNWFGAGATEVSAG